MNRLAGSASLYLRQHADNPVDWWPWSEGAFDEARRRDVPVLVSIGYAACHWCHVMAHESFEDPVVAARVNELVVAIKVDREERPDVDALYMSATQAMTGHGGWPMTVFVDHDARPFFAGTYFPPTRRHGQPSFRELLASVADVWATRRDDVLEQSAQLADAVRDEATLQDRLVATGAPRGGPERLERLVDVLSAQLDARDGGFSPAPKFPHASWIDAALASFVATGRDDARSMAVVTLDAMARGGLFDHVAGGFARYSVDTTWTVPHFEKMLSDQALLAMTYTRAAAWLEAPAYGWVARRTLDFVLTTMRVDGGFASGIDADAGGVEGAHVVLTPATATRALVDAGLERLVAATLERYSIDDVGDLDGATVPHLRAGADLVGTTDDAAARGALLAARALGPAPAIDDKVLLEWNAMLAVALAEAAWRLDEPRYGDEAIALVARLGATHHVDGRWRRRGGVGAPLATSADLGWLVEALVGCSSSSTATPRTSTPRGPSSRTWSAGTGTASVRRASDPTSAAGSSRRTSRRPGSSSVRRTSSTQRRPRRAPPPPTPSRASRWRRPTTRCACSPSGSWPSASRCSTRSPTPRRRSSRRPASSTRASRWRSRTAWSGPRRGAAQRAPVLRRVLRSRSLGAPRRPRGRHPLHLSTRDLRGPRSRAR